MRRNLRNSKKIAEKKNNTNHKDKDKLFHIILFEKSGTEKFESQLKTETERDQSKTHTCTKPLRIFPYTTPSMHVIVSI